MKKRSSNKKVANGLVAASAAAVVAVYSAGYARTRSAADQFEGRSAERRPSMPRPGADVQPVALNANPAPALAPAKADTEPELVASAKPIQPKTTSQEAAPPAEVTTPTATAPPAAQVAVQPTPTPAPAPAPAANDYKAIIAAALPPWKDGTYDGWGTCRHGDLQVSVVIENGKISSANIAQCLTRYSCDIIDKLPGQVIQRQSPEVSYVSGATQSTDAYYWAVVVALGKAR